MAMKMKKKNSLPDMYSPEKKFSGFFVYWHAGTENKKELAKAASKKRKKEQIRNPAFHIIAYFSYCTKGSRQSGCLIFTKKQKYIEIQEGKTMKHFELGQMHKVDINEGFKEIKTAPERSGRSMS